MLGGHQSPIWSHKQMSVDGSSAQGTILQDRSYSCHGSNSASVVLSFWLESPSKVSGSCYQHIHPPAMPPAPCMILSYCRCPASVFGWRDGWVNGRMEGRRKGREEGSKDRREGRKGGREGGRMSKLIMKMFPILLPSYTRTFATWLSKSSHEGVEVFPSLPLKPGLAL